MATIAQDDSQKEASAGPSDTSVLPKWEAKD